MEDSDSPKRGLTLFNFLMFKDQNCLLENIVQTLVNFLSQ